MVQLIPLAIVFLVIATVLWFPGLGGILVTVFLILFAICLIAGFLL